MGLTLVERLEKDDESMPAWIIKKIREEERRKQKEQPRIDLPLHDPWQIPPGYGSPQKKEDGGTVIEIQILYHDHNIYKI